MDENMNKKMEQEDWLNTLQHKMRNYKEPIDDTIWKQIEEKLPVVHTRHTIANRRFGYAVAAAVVVLVGLSVFFSLIYTPITEKFANNTTSTKTATQTIDRKNSIADKIIAQTIVEGSTTKTKPTSSAHYKLRNQTGYSQSVLPEKTDFSTPDEVNKETKTESPQKTIDETIQNDKEKKNSNNTNRRATKETKKRRLPEMVTASATDSHSSRPWSIGLSVGSGGIQNNTNGSDMAASNDPEGFKMLNCEYAYYKVTDMNYSNNSFHHHQPISFGLTVCKSLDKSFSIESGLVFTMLISDVDAYDKKQQLYYIGIPIKGNWSFYREKQVQLYLTAGAMGEKCFYARIGGKKLKLNALQFSINGGAGIAYGLTNHLSIYGEAGVAYFFDDGSFVQSIRKEKPCNMNLQAGLRFTY